MRVVAGTARGRRLVTPPGDAVRPTSDRVREAMFNSLISLGAVEEAAALDLFAGSGALGREALSRGAERVTFVERHRAALAAIDTNLRATSLHGSARVVRGDALGLLERHDELIGPYDLVLCDPPYAFAGWGRLFASLPCRLAADAVVVVEADHDLDPGDGWRVLRAGRYGGTVVTLTAPT
ncbi:16S rRNA (guanine(966)-N(2))-methyltransferase RsmD [soil metagenome]